MNKVQETRNQQTRAIYCLVDLDMNIQTEDDSTKYNMRSTEGPVNTL